MNLIFEIDPVPKPRMNRSDAWKKRPCVVRYWEYKDKLVEIAKEFDFKLNSGILSVEFYIPMPKSWSVKKKSRMVFQPHTQRPDLDNLIKAFQDCLLEEDSHIHTFYNVSKKWSGTGCIIVNV